MRLPRPRFALSAALLLCLSGCVSELDSGAYGSMDDPRNAQMLDLVDQALKGNMAVVLVADVMPHKSLSDALTMTQWTPTAIWEYEKDPKVTFGRKFQTNALQRKPDETYLFKAFEVHILPPGKYLLTGGDDYQIHWPTSMYTKLVYQIDCVVSSVSDRSLLMQGNMNEPAIDCWQRNLAVCLFGAFTTVFAMTLILPFLPVYIGQLGVSGHAAIVQWSGIAYAATFVTAGLVAPLWGMLGDRYGRKPMLVRASLGMAITMLLMGLASDIWQFIGLRLLAGIAGGYSSGATILVAVQAPKSRSAWALGLLSSGVMAGNLLGPLVGGFLPPLIGIRATFWGASGLIFIAFVFTTFMLRETARPSVPAVEEPPKVGWSNMPNKAVILAMLATGLLLMIANMSVEPIITVYIETLLEDSRRVTSVAGLAMSAAALGSIISATYLGKVADRIGYGVIMIAALSVAAVLLIPQAFVYAGWQLIALRFLMGMALGGLLPCMAAVIRHSVPERFVGSAMGWSLSAQFAGQVIGPVIGGFVGGQFGMRSVFLVTSLLMLAGALFNWRALGHSTR